MAFSSYDSMIASCAAGKRQELQFAKTLTLNAAGQAMSLWEESGMPVAGGSGTSLTGRVCNSSTSGGLSFGNPTGTDSLYLTSGWVMPSASTMGTLLIYDRLTDISGIDLTSTALQAITMGALPRYANGNGVQMFLEISTNASGSTPVFTVNYVDQGGSASVTPSMTAVAAQPYKRLIYTGSMWIPLAAGDSGVQKVTGIQFSAAGTAGTGRLVLAYPLATFPLLTGGTVVEKDFVTQTPRLPQLYNDHCLAALLMGATGTTGTINASLTAVAG